MNRIFKVVRLHLVNRNATLAMPWLVLGIAFSITLLIWFLVRSVTSETGDAPDVMFSGAGASIIVYMLIYAVLAITSSFPFALGLSVTRRDFYLGTALTMLLLSAVYSVVLVALSYIEQLTNGWGLGGQIFGALWFGEGGPLQRWALYTLCMLFFSALGMSIATIYMRWRMSGMLVFWAITTLLVLGVPALISYTSSWASVGRWFVDNGAIGIALWTLIPTVLAAGAGYLVLRKATPKN